jgi:hypothetical protein
MKNQKLLTALLLASMALMPLTAAAAPTVDDARAAAAGIRKLPGKRLTLYTDLVVGGEIDRLPALFEQAFPQWCKYFGVNEGDHADWHITGCLMKDKAKFVAAGLLPDDVPVPPGRGFTRDDTSWLYEQPTDFYRRELLLHEGTHAFMFTLLGSCGPPWYMEGLAEYLGTHRLQDGRLTLGYMPKNREESPGWGRVRIIQDAVAQRRALKLKAVIELPPTAFRETEPYAWCWAAVTLLDRHPRYRDRFHQLIRYVREPDFNERFRRLFEPDWQQLCEEWQLMVVNMEYGYDVERSAVDFTPAKVSPGPLADGPHRNSPLPSGEGPHRNSPLPLGEGQGVRAVTIAADRGWQNTGLRLEAGKKYRLTASGRYQVAKSFPSSSGEGPTKGSPLPSGEGPTKGSPLPLEDGPTKGSPLPLGEGQGVRATDPKTPRIWWSEPGGISIRYYKGRPLGILLAAVRPDHPPANSTTALIRPTAVGLGTTLSPAESGTLFLKINDSPGELDDNAGELKVEVRRD